METEQAPEPSSAPGTSLPDPLVVKAGPFPTENVDEKKPEGDPEEAYGSDDWEQPASGAEGTEEYRPPASTELEERTEERLELYTVEKDGRAPVSSAESFNLNPNKALLAAVARLASPTMKETVATDTSLPSGKTDGAIEAQENEKQTSHHTSAANFVEGNSAGSGQAVGEQQPPKIKISSMALKRAVERLSKPKESATSQLYQAAKALGAGLNARKLLQTKPTPAKTKDRTHILKNIERAKSAPHRRPKRQITPSEFAQDPEELKQRILEAKKLREELKVMIAKKEEEMVRESEEENIEQQWERVKEKNEATLRYKEESFKRLQREKEDSLIQSSARKLSRQTLVDIPEKILELGIQKKELEQSVVQTEEKTRYLRSQKESLLAALESTRQELSRVSALYSSPLSLPELETQLSALQQEKKALEKEKKDKSGASAKVLRDDESLYQASKAEYEDLYHRITMAKATYSDFQHKLEVEKARAQVFEKRQRELEERLQQTQGAKTLLKSAFDRYDFDKSGELTQTEVKALLQDLSPAGAEITSEAVEEYIQQRDGNRTGTLNFEEFCQLYVHIASTT